MRIGISTASLFGKAYTEDAFAIISELGARETEVFMATFSEYKREFAEMMRGRVDEYSLTVHSIHALTNQFEPELINKSPRTRGDAMNIARMVLEAGRVLGAKYYTFHGPTTLKKIEYDFDYAYLAERFNDLYSVAAEYGIELCYENVHWTYFSVPEYFVRLKGLCPDLKACLDIKQAMQSGIPYSAYIRAMGDRIRTVHLCDYDEERKLYLPGKGTCDFVTLFKELKDGGYDGTCLMEVYSRDYETIGELQAAYDYLLECEARANII